MSVTIKMNNRDMPSIFKQMGWAKKVASFGPPAGAPWFEQATSVAYYEMEVEGTCMVPYAFAVMNGGGHNYVVDEEFPNIQVYRREDRYFTSTGHELTSHELEMLQAGTHVLVKKHPQSSVCKVLSKQELQAKLDELGGRWIE